MGNSLTSVTQDLNNDQSGERSANTQIEIDILQVLEGLQGVDVVDSSCDDSITIKIVQEYFESPNSQFSEKFAEYVQREKITVTLLKKQNFIDMALEVTDLQSNQALVDYYSNIMCGCKDVITDEGLKTLIWNCFILALRTIGCIEVLDYNDLPCWDAFLLSIKGKESTVTKDVVRSWCLEHCQQLFSGIHCWTRNLLTKPGYKQALNLLTEEAELLISSILELSCILTLPLLWMMSCSLSYSYRQRNCTLGSGLNTLPEVFHWTLLYNSNSHGLSPNRFGHHILDYNDSTVLLLDFEDGHQYCLAVDGQWKESNMRWGGSQTMLIQLKPQYKIIQAGENMIFMNFQTRGLPKGIHIGKDSRRVVLEVDEDFGHVNHYGVKLKLFKMEVWGCGSDEARQTQIKQKLWEKKEAERHKNRKLKLENWEDNPDRQLLSWGGVKTNYSAGHRDDGK